MSSASVTVAFEARRLQVPVTPGTRLVDVRNKSCEKFGLNAAEYTLVRQGKQLDLTLPWRLSNLVSNASMELTRAKILVSTLRLKLLKPDGVYLGSFLSTTTIADVAAAAGISDGFAIKLGERELNPALSLTEAGITGAVVLNAGPVVRESAIAVDRAAASDSGPGPHSESTSIPHAGATLDPSRAQPLQPNTRNTPNSWDSISQESPSSPPLTRETNSNERVATIRALGEGPRTDFEPDAEMTPKQFMTYYNYIKAQAEPALLSRSTRERLLKQKRREYHSTVVRVRLPDQHILESEFAANETGTSVYAFVKRFLRHPEQTFELVSSSPAHTLQLEENLISDCDFGGRVLLYFRFLDGPRSSDPLLTDEALALIKPTQPSQNVTSSATPDSAQAPATAEAKATAKIVPKWLKLHK